MRERPTAAPTLPTADRVKPTRPIKIEDLATTSKQELDELLKQVIVEAKSFRRDGRERHDLQLG